MRRRLARGAGAVAGIAGALTLLARPLAWAGTDVFQNIGPASPLGSAAAFARYPLSRYGLDQHFTVVSASITGGVDVSGLLPEIAWFFASMVWFFTSFLAKVVIELFAFAFNLDLVNGSSATGGAGALGPVSQAIHSIYANVLGAPWLVLAFSAVAIWAMWKALVQRRYSETAGALALSLIYIVVALFFVVEPGRTIGEASGWTNEMSQAFLSISSHGTPSEGEAATADDAGQLWGVLVTRPWTVLDFGGLEHCALDGTGDEDSDPVSAPVRPLSADPAQDAALSRQLAEGTEVAAEGKTCIDNENKYDPHFLRFGYGTEERDEEYEALNHGNSGELPEADTEKAGYKLGVADKPATDAMEEGGQYQRVGVAVFVAAGEVGAFALLGALSIGVILSQVLLLLLLAFSPVALLAAAIPGRGHDFFKAWLGKLAGYLLRKAAYSLVLAILLAVNAAIGDATSQLGWLFSFGLQAAFFWAVLLQRHTLTAGIVGVATGQKAPGRDLALDAVALYGGARLGLGSLRGAGRLARGAGRTGRWFLGGGDDRGGRRPSFGGVSETRIVDWSSGGRKGKGPKGGPEKGGPEERGPAGGGGGGDEPERSPSGAGGDVEGPDGPPETRGAGGGGGGEEPDRSDSDPGDVGPDGDPSTDGLDEREGEPEKKAQVLPPPDVEGAPTGPEASAEEAPGPDAPRVSEDAGVEGRRRPPKDSGKAAREQTRRRPGHRPDPVEGERPEVAAGEGTPEDAGSPRRPGSTLSEELRVDRERSTGPATRRPATGPDVVPDPPADPARLSREEDHPTATPPRRRRRLRGRRR